MKLLTNLSKISKSILYMILLFIVSFSTIYDLKSQDLFASLPNSTTSYVTSSTVAANGVIYITVWGSGVFRSFDKGQSWTPVNTGLTNFNLTDIEFISSNEILISTMGGGIFKTTSITNVNWIQSNAGLSNLDVRSIKKYPTGMVLIGTYGHGIYISKNKGDNWLESSKGFLYKDVTTIEVADNGWIVAGTYGGGVFQSRDTAKTWSKQSSGLRNLFINEIKRSPLDYLYAATNGRGVYFSVNDGIAWAELDTFMTRPQKIIPVPLPDLNATSLTFNKNLNPVFGSRYGGIYAEDRQEDFTWIPTRIRGIGVNTLCQSTTEMYGFFPNFAPHSSDNFGEEWTELEDATLKSLAQPTKLLSIKAKEIIAYYDKNVKKTTDEGKTWIQAASTPKIINKISMDSSGNYYAATEGGLYFSDPTLSNWNLVKCRDTMVLDVEIGPTGTRFIATRYYKQNDPPAEPIDVRKIWFSHDGNNWNESGILFDKKSKTPHDIGVNYNGNVYLAAGDVVFYSTNNGNQWFPTSGFPNNVASIGFLRDNTVLVGTEGSGLYKSKTVNTFEVIPEYPASLITLIHVGKNDYIYTSGVNILIDAAFSTVEATYMSIDKGKSFININKDFNGESVMSFTVNNSGDMYMSTFSGMIYRAVDKKNLSIPSPISLPDKARDIDVDSVFSWTSAIRAELYQLQISYDIDFTYPWEYVTQLDTVHKLANKLDFNHTYYWRVRAKNHDAVSDWSAVRTFSSKLSKPVLIAPANNAIGVPVNADMLWNKVDSAAVYKIQISKHSNFDVLEFELISGDTTITTPLLDGRTDYFWRVKANNLVSTSDWSAIWKFTTVFGPPELRLPVNESVGNLNYPLMVWEKAIDVESYDLQISDKEDFSDLAFDTNSVITLSVTSGVLEYNKMYYWRVRSRIGQVISAWSNVWKFTTGYSPVELRLPAHNSVNVAINTQFEWLQHSLLNKYEIGVSKSANFTNYVLFDTVDNLLNYTANGLEAYQEYFWRVRVISNINTGVWSSAFKFKTKVNVITLRFPNDNTINHPLTIKFLWFGTNGATDYHLQIANDEQFNDLIFSQDTIASNTHPFSELNPNSEYFWRVRAVSPEGVGDWSEVWKFETGNNIPILIAPENGYDKVVNPVKFEWAPVGGALKYEINVSDNIDFTPPLTIFKNNITDNQYISSDLEFPKTYYWRIRAITVEGNSNWSQVWSFITKDPLSVREIISLDSRDIFPNPADKFVNIILPEYISSEFSLVIHDLSGNLIYQSKDINHDNAVKWDCSHVSPGLYFLTIHSSDMIVGGQIIISR
ncbi:MAG: T9SS type A sorting domain-containing protein [Candidatus Kapabacteria bacterium]|nr:T9SS type A sorting domain-containing protein [Candidatus Kapabacteria bacterium]